MRRTKIVATLGPRTSSSEQLEALIQAGMNVARLNFSHGDASQHTTTVERLRRVAARLDQPVAILQDLPGPKLRCGPMKEGSTLEEGAPFTLEVGQGVGDSSRAFASYKYLARDVKPGERILLNDGQLSLRVEQTDGQSLVQCSVLHGGELTSHKGINLPDSHLSIPSFTEADKEHLQVGLRLGVDYVALSFVRSAQDLLRLQQAMEDAGKVIPIIAKIEKPEAVEAVEELLEYTAGIMVARGDLGVEMSLEQVPVLQKQLIEEANNKGKLVITATQMLETMTQHPTPTRAEVSDVANAIFDGSDALMLSGETAVGDFPIEAVSTMVRIIEQAERYLQRRGKAPPSLLLSPLPFPNIVAKATVVTATSLDLRAIVAFTLSGMTASLLSDYRPPIPILAFTPSREVWRRLALYWGVIPLFWEDPWESLEERLLLAEKQLLQRQLVAPQDPIVVAADTTMRLHYVGSAPP